MNVRSLSTLAALALFSLSSHCGDGKAPLDNDNDGSLPGPGRDGAVDDADGWTIPETGCGNLVCDGGETCSTCRLDCGFCAECGDGTCGDAESCSSCPVDCGRCAWCGDQRCRGDENCANYPEDCGFCATCGDGRCSSQESCATCARDCGFCTDCGNRRCDDNESCSSCPADCGRCAPCGNGLCDRGEDCLTCTPDCGTCEPCGDGECVVDDGENCFTCPDDCGACESVTCQQALFCTLECVDLGSSPASFSISCLSGCTARACPDVQFLIDQVLFCALSSRLSGGLNLLGLWMSCSDELAACFAASCP